MAAQICISDTCEMISYITFVTQNSYHLRIGHFFFNSVVLNRSDTNQPVQSQKMARGWKFWI